MTTVDELKYDYKKTTYIFDLIRDESMDKEAPGMVYKMHKRELKKKKRREADKAGIGYRSEYALACTITLPN